MINEIKVKRYCKDYTSIENYEEAVNDPSQIWICHHILGEILSKEQLIDHDFYYDVPPCMLKFVTKAEHNQIHQNGKNRSEETCKKISESRKGMKLSTETLRKMSVAKKGNTYNKGKATSIFGKAFIEHYGITCSDDRKLYKKEYYFYKCNNKFSWEA